jgi:hypothetical protein
LRELLLARLHVVQIQFSSGGSLAVAGFNCLETCFVDDLAVADFNLVFVNLSFAFVFDFGCCLAAISSRCASIFSVGCTCLGLKIWMVR